MSIFNKNNNATLKIKQQH